MDDADAASLTATMPGQKATMTRLRIAYWYYVAAMTQSDIAGRLGVGRVTVVRRLTEARANREVRFWIKAPHKRPGRLGLRLERAVGLERAVVAPAAENPRNAARLIGFNAGICVSQALRDAMRPEQGAHAEPRVRHAVAAWPARRAGGVAAGAMTIRLARRTRRSSPGASPSPSTPTA